MRQRGDSSPRWTTSSSILHKNLISTIQIPPNHTIVKAKGVCGGISTIITTCNSGWSRKRLRVTSVNVDPRYSMGSAGGGHHSSGLYNLPVQQAYIWLQKASKSRRTRGHRKVTGTMERLLIHRSSITNNVWYIRIAWPHRNRPPRRKPQITRWDVRDVEGWNNLAYHLGCQTWHCAVL